MSGNKDLQGNVRYIDLIRLISSTYKTDQKEYSNTFFDTFIHEIQRLDPLMLAKTVIYFRHQIGINSAIVNLAARLSIVVVNVRWGKHFYNSLIKTPMNMVCVIEALQECNMPVSNSIKKGFAMAFDRFSENEIAASQNNDAEVSLIDVVNIIHPNHSKSIIKLITGGLKITKSICEESIDLEALKTIDETLEKNPNKIIDEIYAITFK